MAKEADDELKIKGSVIKDPRDWARGAYGPEAYQAAISRLSPADRAMVDGTLLPSSWYSVATWDRFLSEMRKEARTRKGDSAETFNMRNMREAGSAIVRTVYKFMLGLLNPRTVIDKGVAIYRRVYSQGQFDLVENIPGRAVVRFTDSSAGFRENLTNNLPTGLVFLLELNGAKDARSQVSRDEMVEGRMVFEVTVTYVV
jgi:hypothetical protein